MMIFQSSAVGEILLGRDAGWQVQRRDDGAVSHRDMVATIRCRHCSASPWRSRLCGLVAVAALDDAGDPRPAACHSDCHAVFIGELGDRIPGCSGRRSRPRRRRSCGRANELASAPSAPLACPLHELRRDAGLREAHLNNLSGQRPRKRGEVDPHLAIARAKIEDAETVEEAAGYLSRRETFAVLNAPAVLKGLLALPGLKDPSARGLRTVAQPRRLGRGGVRLLRNDRLSVACRAAACEASEGWWKRQGSNLTIPTLAFPIENAPGSRALRNMRAERAGQSAYSGAIINNDDET